MTKLDYLLLFGLFLTAITVFIFGQIWIMALYFGEINKELEKEGFFVPCCFGCQSTQNFAILFDTEWLILSKLLNL